MSILPLIFKQVKRKFKISMTVDAKKWSKKLILKTKQIIWRKTKLKLNFKFFSGQSGRNKRWSHWYFKNSTFWKVKMLIPKVFYSNEQISTRFTRRSFTNTTSVTHRPATSNELPNELQTPPDFSVELGILPCQIGRLVGNRRNVKSLMAKPNLTPELKMQYNIRQMALKLTANSMYGWLGFSKSQFYAPHLAALTTCKGRDILMSTKTLTKRLDNNVIHGDTDLIMINTNSQDFEEVYKIGGNIKKAVNAIYKHVELDIDGVYQKLLLFKKKKYAAVSVSQKQGALEYNYEFKGLDIVRRDWSKIASSTGKVELDILLSNSGKEMNERVDSIFEVLSELAKDLAEEKIPLPMLEITKQLTKAPSEYADMSSLPHV
jgi:DNA polymerase alpha subunit A